MLPMLSEHARPQINPETPEIFCNGTIDPEENRRTMSPRNGLYPATQILGL